jgi:hypothetical protein
MQKSRILYEPLPIGRIGVRKDNKEVVITNDFSCFAYMLEEYISYGATKIVMPKSAPETSSLDQMPKLLEDRITVVDDTNELEAMRRILFNLRKEFEVKISDKDHQLKFPEKTSPKLIESINTVHSSLKKLSLGFNHGVQVYINPQFSIKNIGFLRKKSSSSEVRLILAQLEAILKNYQEINFDAPTPPKDKSPTEIISIFDRLINDQNYIEYSDLMYQLASKKNREEALAKLRELERSIRSRSFISTGWDYFAKLIQVSIGVPIPDSSSLANVFKGRSLPALVNLSEARSNALEMWKKSDNSETPIRRDGTLINNTDIIWLPPVESMEFSSPHDRSPILGKIKDISDSLEELSKYLDD